MTPFLWKRNKKLTLLSQRPSPKHRQSLKKVQTSIERVSLRASLRRGISAGMTVEAALVLPLFLFFFVNLGCAMEMIRLHGNLELALWNTGNKVCLYGYVLGDERETAERVKAEKNRQWWEELAGVALSYTYIRSDVVAYAGEKYLEQSPLKSGVSGLQFWESSLPLPDDKVDILMTYQVSPWLEIPAVGSFRMQNRYYGHLWTGYRIPGICGESDEDGDVVYITEYASVYHESMQCTHLKLSIREVTLQEALSSRNEYGGRYRECEKCRGAPFKGTVFIGKDGDCYHYDRGCSGLKRTVRTIPRREAVLKYRSCSRCGGG